MTDDGEIRYKVMDLIDYQPSYLILEWTSYPNIPNDVRFINKGINPITFMENMVAMFIKRSNKGINPKTLFKRRSNNPWVPHSIRKHVTKQQELDRRLRGVLNTITPAKYYKIEEAIIDIVSQFAETRHALNQILDLIFTFSLRQPLFASQFARLTARIHDYLPTLGLQCDYKWIKNDNRISETFRKMIIISCNKAFSANRQYEVTKNDLVAISDPNEIQLKKQKKINTFFEVLITIAELYNYNMLSIKLIYKGIFDALLPPKNKKTTGIDIEGLCILFKICGKKLELENTSAVNSYLSKLTKYAKTFDFRTTVLVDEVKVMRSNKWKGSRTVTLRKMMRRNTRTETGWQYLLWGQGTKTKPKKNKKKNKKKKKKKKKNKPNSTTELLASIAPPAVKSNNTNDKPKLPITSVSAVPNKAFNNDIIHENQCKLKFDDWLKNIVYLNQYIYNFENQEYDDITMIPFMDEHVVYNDLKINNDIHCKLLLQKIKEFKDMTKEFNIMLENNSILKKYKDTFTRNGILTLNDLKRDIATNQDVQKMLNINDQIDIQRIFDVIHDNT